MPEPSVPLNWQKSSYSGGDSDKTDCVEVAFAPSGDGAFVRDSKDPEGGMFRLSREGWRAFLTAASKIEVPPAG
ncbi:DUF397 domain-containing protein [Amycolatopsis rubida]|uniref:DUF397 domain-containing protein n=2 Tax=Pseudonocardiaceae TaxID=2070 RepID=A0ABX0BMZ1_9PSEU|nr:DUF397 domain-containing protein [Amycolatopsis rubida]MYW95129.1 DUF397 domain-containing protein [Amycolatopsis rubida]NEC55482.1 DUF397 domain-containing protein [Amycolatopsis rubida]NEC60117.1 DUF397 domain-containing protein [Amycolatopsis rubida]